MITVRYLTSLEIEDTGSNTIGGKDTEIIIYLQCPIYRILSYVSRGDAKEIK